MFMPKNLDRERQQRMQYLKGLTSGARPMQGQVANPMRATQAMPAVANPMQARQAMPRPMVPQMSTPMQNVNPAVNMPTPSMGSPMQLQPGQGLRQDQMNNIAQLLAARRQQGGAQVNRLPKNPDPNMNYMF